METITTNVYTIGELSEVAKEKARDWYRDVYGDDPMLPAHMQNLTAEALEERGYKIEGHRVDVYYDLNYVQRSGFYFTGVIVKDDVRYTVSQRGMGYTCFITYEDANGEMFDAPQAVRDDVKAVNKEMLARGRAELEYQDSAEYIDEALEANEYTFTIDGKRFG